MSEADRSPVRLVWRDHRAPRSAAWQHIGPWPGVLSGRALGAVVAAGGPLGSPSHNHAVQTWDRARETAARSVAGGGGSVPVGMADLAMVSALASHLAVCDRCWRTGPLDTTTPVEWLTWAVARRPGLRRVLAPVLAELAGSRAALKRDPPGLAGSGAGQT